MIGALGFFDSVHLGHRAIISGADIVFTFDDEFFTVLKRDTELVYTAAERLEIIKKLAPRVEVFNSNEILSKTASEFISFLKAQFDITEIVVGEDYTMGRERHGIAELKSLCEAFGIVLKSVKLLEIDGKKIASTAIREYLLNGEIEKANALLGAAYFMSGEVIAGFRRGRTMNFPTANLSVSPKKLFPKSGVYKTSVLLNGTEYRGITNIGVPTTFNLESPTIETHILNFDGDLYGKAMAVRFLKYIRPIIKFNSLQELKEQIESDINIAYN